VCGIAGFTNPAADAPAILDDMLEAMAWRGPDGRGVHVDGDLGLGHVRLAVIDLDGGAQPRVDQASGDALVFNGEIYGYRAHAAALHQAGVALADDSDTEVLFQMLRRHGVAETLRRIDGMFAFAFRDGAGGRLYLARDRFGEKPLFYGVRDGALAFASEPGALRRHPGYRSAGLDAHAVAQFLAFDFVPGPRSGFDGIAKLGAGSVLCFAGGTAEVERFWRPAVEPGDGWTGDPLDRLETLLDRSVRERLIADVPVGVFLSGGIDSSLVAAVAARHAPAITAYTVSFADQSYDEAPFAAEVARHLGLRHEVAELATGDLLAGLDAVEARISEPLADPSILPTWLVCRHARAGATVALGGDGADELFAGYPNFAVRRWAPLMAAMPRALGRLLAAAVGALPASEGYMSLDFRLRQLAQGLGAPADLQSFLWMAPFAGRDHAALFSDAFPARAADPLAPAAEAVAALDVRGGLARLQRLFLRFYLAEDILAKVDRASMFHSLEVRSPFLDRDLAAFALSLPARLKLGAGGGKHLLRRLARKLLPARVAERRKHGFAPPIAALMRGPLRARVTDVVLDPGNALAPWFDRGTLEALVTRHMSGRFDHRKQLWALYVLFSWARRAAA